MNNIDKCIDNNKDIHEDYKENAKDYMLSIKDDCITNIINKLFDELFITGLYDKEEIIDIFLNSDYVNEQNKIIINQYQEKEEEDREREENKQSESQSHSDSDNDDSDSEDDSEDEDELISTEQFNNYMIKKYPINKNNCIDIELDINDSEN